MWGFVDGFVLWLKLYDIVLYVKVVLVEVVVCVVFDVVEMVWVEVFGLWGYVGIVENFECVFDVWLWVDLIMWVCNWDEVLLLIVFGLLVCEKLIG